MSHIVLYGFPRSTYVNVVRLVLEHKGLAYDFRDLESEMGKPTHLALHPFNRVPVLEHGDFRLYETAAIIAYLDDAFPQSRLTPEEAQLARTHESVDRRAQRLLLSVHRVSPRA